MSQFQNLSSSSDKMPLRFCGWVCNVWGGWMVAGSANRQDDAFRTARGPWWHDQSCQGPAHGRGKVAGKKRNTRGHILIRELMLNPVKNILDLGSGHTNLLFSIKYRPKKRYFQSLYCPFWPQKARYRKIFPASQKPILLILPPKRAI